MKYLLIPLFFILSIFLYQCSNSSSQSPIYNQTTDIYNMDTTSEKITQNNTYWYVYFFEDNPKNTTDGYSIIRIEKNYFCLDDALSEIYERYPKFNNLKIKFYSNVIEKCYNEFYNKQKYKESNTITNWYIYYSSNETKKCDIVSINKEYFCLSSVHDVLSKINNNDKYIGIIFYKEIKIQ